MTKSEFRSVCSKRLKSASPATKTMRDAKVRRVLERVLAELDPRTVLAYWPMDFEADIRKTLRSARRRGKVYLPFMDGVSFKMVPLRLPLERKAFGIYEPRDSYRKTDLIDVAIVPAIGVDASLGRIGFGKGMYDRFFPTLKARPFTIFIQSCECLTNRFLCDDYDVRSDLLITPRGAYSMRKTHVERTTRRRRHCRRQRCSRIFNFEKDFRRPF
ncbi:MAG: 5-formyltetrahydrofolate cyclo-ligase [Campylobacterota bacterium]